MSNETTLPEVRADIRTITTIVNQYQKSLYVQNHEDPLKSGNFVEVSVGQSGSCNMWTPWCNEQAGLVSGHYIQVILQDNGGGHVRELQIFQSGAYIWYTSRMDYPTKIHVPGHSSSGAGPYRLTIHGDGTPSVTKL